MVEKMRGIAHEVGELQQGELDRGDGLAVDVDLDRRGVPSRRAGGRAVELGDDARGGGAVVLEGRDLGRGRQQVPCAGGESGVSVQERRRVSEEKNERGEVAHRS